MNSSRLLAIFSALLAALFVVSPVASAAPAVKAGDNLGGCTLGFIVEAYDGTPYGLTAGHCAPTGTVVWVGGQAVGTVVERQFPPGAALVFVDVTGAEDWGVIRFRPGVTASPATSFGGATVRTGVVDHAPYVGQRVCTQGATSGHDCGQIVQIRQGGEWIVTDIPRQVGDSGGPLYSAETGASIGVNSHGPVGGNGPTSTYFSVSHALQKSTVLSGVGTPALGSLDQFDHLGSLSLVGPGSLDSGSLVLERLGGSSMS